MSGEFEAVIGLEVHCQLATESKIFCSCPARLEGGKSVADIEPNSNVCPICAGHPGTLPVLNRKVVEYAIRAGLATNCEIQDGNVFARKNYFYPDLPKGYQISQLEKPICQNGWLEIETGNGSRKIGINRIHMEEDAGKNVHMSGYSLVNLNRAGVPLVEIVTNPDLKTATEAGTYLRELYAVVTYLGICDGNMQEGNFRCDANVSVMKKGAKEFGTRVEIKNVNSFRFVEKAIDYEIARQTEVVKSGRPVVQETRMYDSAKNTTYSMRTKEEAQDYRYFPDPDLVSLKIVPAWIESIRKSLPELPAQRKHRYLKDFGLPLADSSSITSSKGIADFFEATLQTLAKTGRDPKTAAKPAANWLTGEITRILNEENSTLKDSKLTPTHFADLVHATIDGTLSSTGAKQVLVSVWKTGADVSDVIEREGLKQVNDTGALERAVDEIIAAHPAQVAEFKSGKDKILGFFVGQAMKKTGGKANPGLLGELFRKKLSAK